MKWTIIRETSSTDQPPVHVAYNTVGEVCVSCPQENKPWTCNSMDSFCSCCLLLFFIGASGFQASLSEISLPPGVDAFCSVDLLFILGTFLNSSLLLSVLKGF